MKRKTKRRAQKVYNSLLEMSANSDPHGAEQLKLHSIQNHSGGSGNRLKKFRFQLFHQWLVTHFEPCRVADIGGGKSLLSYLLQEDGWKATVIDPVYQALPHKYKNISSNKQVKIASTARVPHITSEFQPEMAQNFDLLIGLHAHGVNIKIINAATEYGKDFVLVPCCIIDEPVYPRLGVSWVECLTDYAIRRGCKVQPFQLKFSGQNIGIYTLGNRRT